MCPVKNLITGGAGFIGSHVVDALIGRGGMADVYRGIDVVLDRDAGHAVRTFVERGFEHHTVLAWGELRPELRQAARLLELELVEC